jgi:hypothetical protein
LHAPIFLFLSFDFCCWKSSLCLTYLLYSILYNYSQLWSNIPWPEYAASLVWVNPNIPQISGREINQSKWGRDSIVSMFADCSVGCSFAYASMAGWSFQVTFIHWDLHFISLSRSWARCFCWGIASLAWGSLQMFSNWPCEVQVLPKYNVKIQRHGHTLWAIFVMFSAFNCCSRDNLIIFHCMLCVLLLCCYNWWYQLLFEDFRWCCIWELLSVVSWSSSLNLKENGIMLLCWLVSTHGPVT